MSTASPLLHTAVWCDTNTPLLWSQNTSTTPGNSMQKHKKFLLLLPWASSSSPPAPPVALRPHRVQAPWSEQLGPQRALMPLCPLNFLHHNSSLLQAVQHFGPLQPCRNECSSRCVTTCRTSCLDAHHHEWLSEQWPLSAGKGHTPVVKSPLETGIKILCHPM